MASASWDDHKEAREALRTIVSDPTYGVAALSSSQTMANLLKDLLPDAPREASVLVAAAEAGVASKLQDYISKGMDVGTASAVVAGSFAARAPYKPEACSWAVGELAVALGLDPAGTGAPQGTSLPGGAQETMTAMPGAAPGAGYPQGGYPQGGAPGAGYPQGGYPQGGYQPGAAPGAGYPQGGYQPGGFPPTDQASPAGAYPSAPGSQGSAPGVYQPPPGPGYWPQQQSGYPVTARTNGLAIASLVLGVVWFFWLGSVAGLILGLVALRQIKERNEGGRPLAIAGIVLSAIGLAVLLLIIILGAIGAATTNGNSG